MEKSCFCFSLGGVLIAICIVVLIAGFIFKNDDLHPPVGRIITTSKCVLDIRKNNSVESMLVAKADIYIKDKTPHKYKDIGLEEPSLAYSTKVTITIYGNIVPKSIKRQCFERGCSTTDSCIYKFKIIRGDKIYNVELPLQGFLSNDGDIFDAASCWLDYPAQNNVTWIESPPIP